MHSCDHSSKIYTNDTITIMAAIKLESLRFQISNIYTEFVKNIGVRPSSSSSSSRNREVKRKISSASSFISRKSTPRKSDARFVEQRENRISQRFAGIIPGNVGDMKKSD